MDLFELNGRVVVNLTDAVKAFDEIQKEGQQTESKMSKFFKGIGKGAVVVGKTIGAGLAAGATAFAGLTGKALSASGELEQNMGGSEAVFKQYADKMQGKAKEAFSNMGLSTSDYLATANKMGALFQGAGFDIEESMSLSSDAMQRAADVASIMGIDTGSAMEAIAGAAKGNFTMLDNLGVAMNDTTLQAYALEKGINKSTAEMTNQEKIGLAMEMFMEKTAYAAENYAKENETLAGSLGTAKAALTNFLDGSGDVESLVSSFGNLANAAVKSLQEILPRLTTGLTDIVNQIMPMLPPLLEQLLPACVEGAVSLINGIVSALPGILNALMGALPALIQGVQTIINSLIMALPQIMQTLVAALPTLIPLLVDALVSMIVLLCTMLPQIIQPIIDYLPEIIISIVDALMQNLPALIEGCVQLVAGLVAALPQIILGLLNATPTVMTSIVEGLIGALPVLIDGWNTIWEAVTSAISTYMTNISDVVQNIWNAIVNSVRTILNNLKNIISTVWNGIKSVASSVWNGIKSTISGVVNGIKSTVSNAFNGIKSTATSIWNGIKTAIQKPIESARDLVSNAIEKIKGFFNFSISWPKIPMPHFGLTPTGWKIGDLLKGSIPKLSIEWYAKAMRQPMIMDEPTIFGYDASTGQLMGGGEAGSEVVTGTSTLLRMIGDAVESKTAEQNNHIIAVLTAILNAILSGNQEMLQALLAGQTFKVGEREFARLVKQYA